MKILAIRFSAMGDVILTMPVLKSVLEFHQDLHIDMLTKKSFQIFFKDIDRLNIIKEDIAKEYHSIFGLVRLFNTLKKNKYDMIIDLHGSLRSKMLCYLFKLSGVPFQSIDKGREQKKKLLGRIGLQTRPLRHTTERYADVFRKRDIEVEMDDFSTLGFTSSTIEKNYIHNIIKENEWEQSIKIGIAPFSQHLLKSWPLERIQSLIESLISIYQHRVQLFLFGGGQVEMDILSTFKKMNSDHIHIAAEYFDLAQQIEFMNHLNLMISMDSANLHLANLTQCKRIISLWGPTHLYLGFAPLIPNRNVIIEIATPKLACRPCSVYGNIPCSRGDHACMEWISVEMVMDKVKVELA